MEDVRGLMYVGSLLFEHELNELNEFIRNYERNQIQGTQYVQG